MVEMYVKGRFKDGSIKNFRLARIRAYRNLFMKDISREVGITLSLYEAIESLRCYPTDELRIKISSVLKEDADYLFPERFRAYCSENYRRINGISEDVLDRLNRVKFNAKAFNKTPDNEDYRKSIEDEDDKEYIEKLLKNISLPLIKREILYSRFGLAGRKFHTLKKLGEVFHLTRARAQQIEQEVIEKIKHHSISKKLEDLFL